MKTSTEFSGKIWTVESTKFDNGLVHEKAIRPAGVRVMATAGNNILINTERRLELNGQADHRLPGGSIVDTAEEWNAVKQLGMEEIIEIAKQQAITEAHEEAGIIIKPDDIEFIARDINGGKSEWDLFYFIAHSFEVDPSGPSFTDTESEEIIGWRMFSATEAVELALNHESGMSESRSARHVLKWALGKLAS